MRGHSSVYYPQMIHTGWSLDLKESISGIAYLHFDLVGRTPGIQMDSEVSTSLQRRPGLQKVTPEIGSGGGRWTGEQPGEFHDLDVSLVGCQ